MHTKPFRNYLTALHQHPSDIINIRILVNAGSALEMPECAGAAHYLEHMFFKGTKKRTYKQINKDLDRLGEANAGTNKELTVYHITTDASRLDAALELLTDMVFNIDMKKAEVDKEKTVILEECQMYLDRPTSFFFNEVNKSLLTNQLGQPTIGTMDSIQQMTLEKLEAFRNKFYTPNNMLISVTGNVSFDQLHTSLEKYLPELDDSLTTAFLPHDHNLDDITFHHNAKQACMALIFPGLSHAGNWNSHVSNNVMMQGLGQGMSSLMHEHLREKLGLCYSAQCFHHATANGGCTMLFTQLDEKNIDLAHQEMKSLLTQLKEEGLDEETLAVAKEKVLFDFKLASRTTTGINVVMDHHFKFQGQDPQYDLKLDSGYLEAELKEVTNELVMQEARKLFANVDNAKLACMVHGN